MRSRVGFVAVAVLSTALAGGCRTPGVAARPDTQPQVPLISPADLVRRIQDGEPVVFLDVREPQEFAEGHIPGAINIPQREFAVRIDEIDPEALVIPYCNMDFRGFYAVDELRELGLHRIALMQERGLYGWQGQELPVAGGERGLSDEQAFAELMLRDPERLASNLIRERAPANGRTRHVRIRASDWHFDPNDLTVDAGDTVHLILQSDQGDHFFVQPDYELGLAISEGQTQELNFVADMAGEFRFGSCEWDGSALQVMKGRLIVKPRQAE